MMFKYVNCLPPTAILVQIDTHFAEKQPEVYGDDFYGPPSSLYSPTLQMIYG